MTQPADTTCPGCRSNSFCGSYAIPDQPVILNYRFASPSDAMRVRRADLRLVQCAACGLVFNSHFDPALVPYDSNYENTQCCSPAFQDYLRGLATTLIDRYQLKGKRIVEVGCGKGDFLKLICTASQGSGRGYDTTYEGPSSLASPDVHFHSEYLSAAAVNEHYDLVLCRHVVEHVPQIGEFLKALHGIARAAGDPVVFLETPRFEWIVEQESFWDVFYEHCNYFGEDSLRYLCLRAGFDVLRHEAQFGGQYQSLELKALTRPIAAEPPRVPAVADLRKFAAGVQRKREELVARLQAAGSAQGWGIWGAGAKGVALVNQLPLEKPKFVIDSNPAKHGCAIPGSNVPVVAPGDPAIRDLRVILIANPNYSGEVRAQLDRVGFKNLAFCA